MYMPVIPCHIGYIYECHPPMLGVWCFPFLCHSTGRSHARGVAVRPELLVVAERAEPVPPLCRHQCRRSQAGTGAVRAEPAQEPTAVHAHHAVAGHHLRARVLQQLQLPGPVNL